MNKIIVFAFVFFFNIAQDLSAQTKFHIELDYHYNLGLSESGKLVEYDRNDFKMYGNSLHLSGMFTLTEECTAGIGIGADRYENPGYNTFPVLATLQFFPLNTIPKGYIYTDMGYAIKTSTSIPGFLGNFGIGYKHMFRNHFGLKLQLGYNYKQLKKGLLDIDNMVYYTQNRHSIAFGIGVVF